jgi:TetR/AcrR family transcriptional regulator, copper-responsive repressor
LKEQKEPRRRGRPRGFDERAVVDAAQALFWKDGAGGVSLDQLSVATGLHKPSIYGAFGGRAGLYVAALDAYIDRGAPDVSGALAARPLSEALRAFYNADLDVFCARQHAPGCFLIGTAIDAAADSEEVRERVDTVFAGLRRTLRRRVETGVADGDLPADADVEAITEIVFATHVALAVAARSGCPRRELTTRFESIVRLIAAMRAS